MKTILKIGVVATALSFMLIADVPLMFEQDVPPLFEQLVPEAHAILGVRRRTRRRTAVVVGTTVHAEDEAQIQQAQQQTALPPAPPATAGKPLPLGSVVSTLPAGCASTPIGGMEYYHCGGNYYRAVFQGNSLVYVTAQPK